MRAKPGTVRNKERYLSWSRHCQDLRYEGTHSCRRKQVTALFAVTKTHQSFLLYKTVGVRSTFFCHCVSVRTQLTTVIVMEDTAPDLSYIFMCTKMFLQAVLPSVSVCKVAQSSGFPLKFGTQKKSTRYCSVLVLTTFLFFCSQGFFCSVERKRSWCFSVRKRKPQKCVSVVKVVVFGKRDSSKYGMQRILVLTVLI